MKHGRRREQWGFYLALLLKDLFIENKTANELQFTEDVTDIMWLNNSETGDMFLFREAYEVGGRSQKFTIFHCGPCSC